MQNFSGMFNRNRNNNLHISFFFPLLYHGYFLFCETFYSRDLFLKNYYVKFILKLLR